MLAAAAANKSLVSDDGSSKEVSAFGNEPKKGRWETKEERKEEKAVETPSAGNSAGQWILSVYGVGSDSGQRMFDWDCMRET